MNDQKFAKIRKHWGLTQIEMAKLMEVSSALIISQWENGYRNPSGIVKKLYRLLDELPSGDAKQFLKWLQSIHLDEGDRRKILSRKRRKTGKLK